MFTKRWDLTPTLLRIPGSTSRLLAGYFMEWFRTYIAVIVEGNNGTENFTNLLVRVTFRLELKFRIKQVLGSHVAYLSFFRMR
jgi:hypothetical protein